MEETHYYPFGLIMAGFSSQAVGNLDNKYKYNGIEYNEDLGISSNEAFFRELNSQIGIWWQIDPKIEINMENWSPYASNFDNPIRYSDPKGDCPTCNEILKEIKYVAKETGSAIAELYNSAGNVARSINAINPLASLVELATGKSTQSDFTEAKPRLMAAADLGVNTLLLFGSEAIRAASSTSKIGTGAAKVGTIDAEAGVGKASAKKGESAAKGLSTNIQKVLNTLDNLKANGGSVKLNPLNPTQEINMTFQKGTQKLDFRIETHTIPQKFGGNGITPQRHMNVDLYPDKNVLPNSGHKILE